MNKGVFQFILRHSATAILVVVVLGFATVNPSFLTLGNLFNILTQASPTIILAAGMTLVLLVGGVDLSVGSVMYVGAAIAATMLLDGASIWLALPVFLLTGLIFGSVNAFFVSKVGVMPFIVTLAMLFVARGLGHTITETRAMNLPESFLGLGATRLAGVPAPILVAGTFVLILQLGLSKTVLGRQIYAVGHDAEMARKAGMRPGSILTICYTIAGVSAALAGIVALSQLGSVAPSFGADREFVAIAAAVMGGASLFGGRGKVFPGAVLGAVLLQTTESGLVANNVDPYLYPVIYAGIIFLAVAIDTLRRKLETTKSG